MPPRTSKGQIPTRPYPAPAGWAAGQFQLDLCLTTAHMSTNTLAFQDTESSSPLVTVHQGLHQLVLAEALCSELPSLTERTGS